jgi:hypothetical protein
MPTKRITERDHRLLLDRFPIKHKYIQVGPKPEPSNDPKSAPEDDGFEFRLFARPKGSGKSDITRVRLDSPVDVDATPGLQRGRPKSYYFKEDLSPKEESQMRSVALTGHQVQQRATYSWSRMDLPFKVKDASIFCKVYPWLEKLVTDFVKMKKVRPGKTSRLAMRKRAQTKAEQETLAMKSSQNKALEERMRKSKKNRDKKLRQREKEKVKKASAHVKLDQP